MILFKPLEHLEKKYSINESDYLDKGSCGKIYLVEDGSLVKVPFDFHRSFLLNDRLSHKRLYDEAKIQNLAGDLGIRLPKVNGFYAVKGLDSDFYYPGFSMQGLGDKTLDKLSGFILEEAERQRDLEIEKARDLGFKINDSHNMNAIWFQEETYLLDAGLWEFRGFN